MKKKNSKIKTTLKPFKLVFNIFLFNLMLFSGTRRPIKKSWGTFWDFAQIWKCLSKTNYTQSKFLFQYLFQFASVIHLFLYTKNQSSPLLSAGPISTKEFCSMTDWVQTQLHPFNTGISFLFALTLTRLAFWH